MRTLRAVGVVAAVIVATAALMLAFDPPHGEVSPGTTADAAVVLSGDVDYVRLKAAAAALIAGRVRTLVLTGAGAGGDSGDTLREVALGLGVPAAAMVVENRSTTTRENLLFAGAIVRAQGWRRVLLVTSHTHMGRAQRVARRAVPEVEWLPSPVDEPGPPSRIVRNRVREWVRFVGYVARGWA